MDLPAYRRLRQRARAHARVPGEAEDLLQSALLAAAEADRLGDAAWIEGTLRRMAALDARSAIRRRRREAVAAQAEAEAAALTDGAAMPPVLAAPAPAPLSAAALLGALPPSARRVAVLALHGLGAEEIRWILGIAPTAFRQRLSRIRQALGELPEPQRSEALALAGVRDPARRLDLQFGLVRRALKAAMAAGEGLGTHDADGHLLVIGKRGAHTRGPGGNA
jgi:RNA polymerase sigma-70 factor (ECF subfamily)